MDLGKPIFLLNKVRDAVHFNNEAKLGLVNMFNPLSPVRRMYVTRLVAVVPFRRIYSKTTPRVRKYSPKILFVGQFTWKLL